MQLSIIEFSVQKPEVFRKEKRAAKLTAFIYYQSTINKSSDFLKILINFYIHKYKNRSAVKRADYIICNNYVFRAVSFKNRIERVNCSASAKLPVSISTAPSKPSPFNTLKISLKSEIPSPGRQVLPFESISEI